MKQRYRRGLIVSMPLHEALLRLRLSFSEPRCYSGSCCDAEAARTQLPARLQRTVRRGAKLRALCNKGGGGTSVGSSRADALHI